MEDSSNPNTEKLGASSQSQKSIWSKKPVLASLALMLTLLGWNALVFVPANRALSGEDNAAVLVYRHWLVSPSAIVFDVRSVEPNHSMAGMDRMLFKTAEALKDQSFDRVILAHRGTGKFVLPGDYFKVIGESYEYQNPVYTMRTMQERLQNLDGSPAFETWTGGWLGVLGKQLEDHNQFHMRWWVEGEIGPADLGAN